MIQRQGFCLVKGNKDFLEEVLVLFLERQRKPVDDTARKEIFKTNSGKEKENSERIAHLPMISKSSAIPL